MSDETPDEDLDPQDREDLQTDEQEIAHPRFSERRAQVEDWARRRRNRKLIVIGALVLLALLMAAATQSALLDIDEVRVVGAQGLEPDDVREVAAVGLGTPVLGLDTDAVERRVRSLPRVKQVAADASWGGVLTIEVLERLPVARVEAPDGVMVLAADGMVIDLIRAEPRREIDADDPGNGSDSAGTEGAGTEGAPAPEVVLSEELAALPEIRGAMFQREVGAFVPMVLDDALLIADALPDDILSVTQGVEITVDSLVLRAVGGGRISVGDARDLDEKFTTIRAFLAQVDLSCLDTLNVRAPAVPVIRRNPNC